MRRYIIVCLLWCVSLSGIYQMDAAPSCFSLAAHKVTQTKATQTWQLNRMAEEVVQTALRYLGVRYRLGHCSPKAFDCSGLTSYVFRQLGIHLPRTSRTQYKAGEVVGRIRDLKKGDLVFFGGRRCSRRVGHVGIVTSVDPSTSTFRFVHADRRGVRVSSSNAAYYKRRYIGARRVIGHGAEGASHFLIPNYNALNDSLSHFYSGR